MFVMAEYRHWQWLVIIRTARGRNFSLGQNNEDAIFLKLCFIFVKVFGVVPLNFNNKPTKKIWIVFEHSL